MTTKPDLPKGLVAFLQAGKQLKYEPEACECGAVTLVQLGKHVVGEVWVHPEDASLPGNSPHAGKKGYYAIPAISLIATCDGYDPEFILMWLPQSQVYGSWDCDHWDLRIFPGVTWAKIASSPLKYVNAQWHPEKVPNEVLVPWPDYAFKRGRPF